MKSITKCLAVLIFAVLAHPNQATAQHYTETVLVSNFTVPNQTPVHDSNLQNPWGLVASPTSPWWVANNAGGTSTLYNGAGQIIPLVVTIPNAPSQPAPGSPTSVM